MTLFEMKEQTFQLSFAAERMWEDELKMVFGKRYLDARYDQSKNQSTPELKRLYEIRISCLKAWGHVCDEIYARAK